MPQPPEQVDGATRGTATDVGVTDMEGIEGLAIGGYRITEAVGPRNVEGGERVASAWDELSAGRDPTDVGPDQRT